MAWTTPKTWSVNEVVTAANMNSHVRDNENWLANDHPRCRATRTAVQSLASGETAIALTGAESYDVGAMHDTVTNPSRITVPSGAAGIYIIVGYLRTVGVGGSFTRALTKLQLNGPTLIAEQISTPPAGSGVLSNVTSEINLIVGDYIELVFNHNTGATLDVTFASLSARWVAF